MMKGALENIRVIDLTRVLAGPYCTMMLADMGAEVIKIEIPGKGDDTRQLGPFKNGESMYYANINRNKKGITLNLKSPEGKKLFLEMVKKADVVVENFRPGVMDKLGVGYDVLKEVNDQIIYAAVSGFGSYGPYFKRPGYDIIAQAMGGLMSITGEEGGNPTRVGNAMGDVLGGLNLMIGVLAALNARQIIGKGQRVDISLVDSVVAALETGTQRYFASGEKPRLMGNRYAAAYPYDSFKAKDGQFVIGCANQKLYQNLCKKVLKREDLISDERFKTNDLRCTNHKALKVEIEKWSENYTIDEAVELILGAGVPAAPILDLERVTKDPHIADAREMFVDNIHPIIGNMRLNGCPIKLMTTKPTIRSHAPSLGQFNEEVYCSFLGLEKEELKNLKDKGVI
ncbi:CaiB/BaiF CoA transferase family protein [Maledivibacter halophilus]|uniref:Formyl-CoA transferase n=1 Tax=Maledivibacter halophilus TaxID=36842 RepID=A0A1T5M4E6_9FIRM|nr:CaiB/BaiF CoA-transferase family protein [Maledivibacter halophilus]SKC83127.1 formyl-CoA transferase [Maledivibacter halophilus]